MYSGYIVRWQSDLVNTKESELPVFDKPYHTNNGFQQNGEETKNVELCIAKQFDIH